MSGDFSPIINRLRPAIEACFSSQAGSIIKAYLVESADPDEEWAVRVHKTSFPQMVFVVGETLWRERDPREVSGWLRDEIRLLSDHYPDSFLLYLYYQRPQAGEPIGIRTSLIGDNINLDKVLTPVLQEIV